MAENKTLAATLEIRYVPDTYTETEIPFRAPSTWGPYRACVEAWG